MNRCIRARSKNRLRGRRIACPARITWDISDRLHRVSGLVFELSNSTAIHGPNFTKHAATSARPYVEELLHTVLARSELEQGAPQLKLRWLTDIPTEENHNFHRFHLFESVLNGETSQDCHTIGLIHQWVRMTPCYPKFAFDPYTSSVRLFNWLRLLSRISDLGGIYSLATRDISDSMYSHFFHIYNNLEFELGGNHLLVELYVLWLFSNILPDDQKVNRVGTKIETLLGREIQNQFAEDGFHFEYAVHYHLQATLVLLQWAYAMHSLGREIDKATEMVIRKAVENAILLRLPNRTMPVIGDKSYSLFTAGGIRDVELLCTLSNHLELMPSDCVRNGAHQIGSKYCVYRDEKQMTVISAGGDCIHGNAGHRHSDYLSFVYWYRNVPIIIDPGTSTYGNDDMSLQYKRAILHNTLSVNYADQALLWRFYRWAYLPRRVHCRIETQGCDLVFVGEYEGFRTQSPVSHQRFFHFNKTGLTIRDVVKGDSTEDLQFNLILHPNCQPELHRESVYLRVDKYCVAIRPVASTAPIMEVDDVMVYPEYNSGVQSKRITMRYQDQKLPFEALIMIEPVPPECK